MIEECFRSIEGYDNISSSVLCASDYGVPQKRNRFFLVGNRLGIDFTFPDRQSSMITVKEAIGDLPVLVSGEKGPEVKEYRCDAFCDYQKRARLGSIGVLNHEAPQLSPINLKRLEYIKPGGNWTDIPDELLPSGMRKARKSDHTKRYGRVTPNGLASTILTKCDPHWGAYFHYEQDRSFTVREAARLQSFPDHFVFTGNIAEQFAQVGNAVPPLLAQAVGTSLKTILEGDY